MSEWIFQVDAYVREFDAVVTAVVDDAYFEFESMRKELVREIEEKVNAEIVAARPVQVRILPRLGFTG